MPNAIRLQSAAGAPPGNTNARGHGLYSKRPPVTVAVPVDASLDDLAELIEQAAGAAHWIASELVTLSGDKLDVEEIARMVVLYAGVAGECDDLVGNLAGHTQVEAAKYGELSPQKFEELLRRSADRLGLAISQIVSAKARLETNGLIVAGRLDNTRELHPTLRYLAGSLRTLKRMVRQHAGMLAWRQAAQQGLDDDPALILLGGSR